MLFLVDYIKYLQRSHLYSEAPVHNTDEFTRGRSLRSLLRQRHALAMKLIRLEDAIWGLRADI